MHSLCTVPSTEFGERARRPGCRAAATCVLVFLECPPIFENYLVSWKHGENGENSEGIQLTRPAVEFASLVVFLGICWGGGGQLPAPQKAIKRQKTTLKACSNLYSSFLLKSTFSNKNKKKILYFM